MVRMLTIANAGSRKIQVLGMDFSDFIYIYIYRVKGFDTGFRLSHHIYIYIEYRQIDR